MKKRILLLTTAFLTAGLSINAFAYAPSSIDSRAQSLENSLNKLFTSGVTQKYKINIKQEITNVKNLYTQINAEDKLIASDRHQLDTVIYNMEHNHNKISKGSYDKLKTLDKAINNHWAKINGDNASITVLKGDIKIAEASKNEAKELKDYKKIETKMNDALKELKAIDSEQNKMSEYLQKISGSQQGTSTTPAAVSVPSVPVTTPGAVTVPAN